MDVIDLLMENKRPLEDTTSTVVNKRHRRQGTWTEEENILLCGAVNATKNNKQWKLIAESVPGRDHVQCMQRWQKVLAPGLKKGPWENEEDSILSSIVVQSTEPLNWSTVATHIGGRTAKQCRERWTLSLDPSINRRPWTPEEDFQIIQLQKAIGNKWSQIKCIIHGRTENQIKTRFNTLKKKGYNQIKSGASY